MVAGSFDAGQVSMKVGWLCSFFLCLPVISEWMRQDFQGLMLIAALKDCQGQDVPSASRAAVHADKDIEQRDSEQSGQGKDAASLACLQSADLDLQSAQMVCILN